MLIVQAEGSKVPVTIRMPCVMYAKLPTILEVIYIKARAPSFQRDTYVVKRGNE